MSICAQTICEAAPSSGEVSVSTAFGRARVLGLAQLQALPAWERLGARLRKGAGFTELVHETIRDGFDHHYLVLEDPAGHIRAIQPLFLRNQGLLDGSSSLLSRGVRALRMLAPNLLAVRTLMVGSPVGEARLGAAPEDADWCAKALLAALELLAPRLGASLIVLKEFPAALRPALACASGRGYARIPSMPYTSLNIRFFDFEQYMQERLSHAFRKNLRRKFRDAARAKPITLEIVSDAAPFIDEIYPLYLQVHERSPLRFEKLSPAYLSQLGQRLPHQTRFFIWRQTGRAIAFSLCSLEDHCLWDEYLGLEYPSALDLHLYFYTLRDIINWCCRNGIQRYYSSPLNYDPKLHLKHELVPMDLYVRHVNPILNLAMRRLLPLLGPTRGEKTLRRFHNFGDLQ